MDGVLADIYRLLLDYDERDSGRRKTSSEIAGTPEAEVFPRVGEYVRTPGFFRAAPVVDDSQKILSELNQRYELFIVSAATEFPQSLGEKQAWLSEHFPFITWQQLVLCGSKRVVSGDIMIDDHFKNLDFFHGRTLLFTQPHNQLSDRKSHERVDAWSDVAKLLL